MILTFDELQYPLRLGDPIADSPSDPRDLWIHFLTKAAEQEVIRLTARKFEETVYTAKLLTAVPDSDRLYLPDAPIKSITIIAEMETWDTSGNPDTVTTISPQDYRPQNDDGTLYLLDGNWPSGRDAIRGTFTVGYDATAIAADSGEMLTFKQLAISMIVQEFALTKETKRHMETTPEGAVYRFVLDARQLEWVDQLRLPRML